MGEDRRKERRKERKERGERERLKRIETEKTLGRIKGSGEVWKYKKISLFVVVYFLLLLCIFIQEVVCDKFFDFRTFNFFEISF